MTRRSFIEIPFIDRAPIFHNQDETPSGIAAEVRDFPIRIFERPEKSSQIFSPPRGKINLYLSIMIEERFKKLPPDTTRILIEQIILCRVSLPYRGVVKITRCRADFIPEKLNRMAFKIKIFFPGQGRNGKGAFLKIQEEPRIENRKFIHKKGTRETPDARSILLMYEFLAQDRRKGRRAFFVTRQDVVSLEHIIPTGKDQSRESCGDRDQ